MGYYADLLANGGPWVTFERCVERAFAGMVGEFVLEDGGPLEGANRVSTRPRWAALSRIG